MKINCALPDGHDHLQNLDEAFQRSGTPIKPVIVILDTYKLMHFLFVSETNFVPGEGRVENIEDCLSNGNALVLPIIFHNGKKANYVDGRHRTNALANRRLKTIPFLTAEAMKDALLAEFGGSQQDALAAYDFANCCQYPIYGI